MRGLIHRTSEASWLQSNSTPCRYLCFPVHDVTNRRNSDYLYNSLPCLQVGGSGFQFPYTLQVLVAGASKLYPRLQLKETTVFWAYGPSWDRSICPFAGVGSAQVVAIKIVMRPHINVLSIVKPDVNVLQIVKPNVNVLPIVKPDVNVLPIVKPDVNVLPIVKSDVSVSAIITQLAIVKLDVK